MADYEILTSETNDKIDRLSKMCMEANYINPEFYAKYNVNRGLRDINGNGVLAGLTEISEIISSKINEEGEKIPCNGELYYRGHKIEDLVNGFTKEKRLGFEEISYLLLFGKLPNKSELQEFFELLASFKTLPASFVRDIIMKATPTDIMNIMARSVLTLYSYDENADDISIPNVLRQCLQLIARFPIISVYGYNAYNHRHDNESLFIHNPKPELSTAENILHLLRQDSSYTRLESEVLDLAMVLHLEHGGGNNSTFTTHVVSSSGSDTYSTIAASLGSLKGPRHGGANIKVIKMFEDMKANLKSHKDEDIKDYLLKILNKDAFDKSGLIYGMGHAVYSLSDPRSDILRNYVKILAKEKNLEKDYELYKKVERIAPEIISDKRKIYKGVSANIDFYSGFVYNMLGLPVELFTPLFAISRIVGWSAHRLEELSNNGKIIRPGYKAISDHSEYVPLKNR